SIPRSSRHCLPTPASTPPSTPRPRRRGRSLRAHPRTARRCASPTSPTGSDVMPTLPRPIGNASTKSIAAVAIWTPISERSNHARFTSAIPRATPGKRAHEADELPRPNRVVVVAGERRGVECGRGPGRRFAEGFCGTRGRKLLGTGGRTPLGPRGNRSEIGRGEALQPVPQRRPAPTRQACDNRQGDRAPGAFGQSQAPVEPGGYRKVAAAQLQMDAGTRVHPAGKGGCPGDDSSSLKEEVV